MLLLRTLPCLAVAAALALPIVATPTSAQACGGFFCNAQTQTPVYQQGERVLFAQYDGLVTMHIEVMYGGDDPSKFAWLLPVPDVPKGADGQPLPLDKAVSISMPELFTTLQAQTNPSFTVTRQADPSYDACMGQRPQPTSNGFADSFGGADTTASDSGSSQPPVVILEEAKVGPYDAQLLEATSSDGLYNWLNTNGYYQDPAAKPLLAYYLSLGYKFVGIRLQADKEVDDLQPLSLRLGENAPCVPLRLTSIAAAADMPILVWVAGNARAVPKNFIHAEVNPQALAWPSASNYAEMVTAAIDMAVGRAWVTEFSGTSQFLDGQFSQTANSNLDAAADLKTLLEQSQFTLGNYAKYVDVLRDEVPKPSTLRGYPYECNFCSDNDDYIPSDDEFYSSIVYYASLPDSPVVAIDLDRLKARLIAEIVEPEAGIREIFERTTHLTRFFTTIDPENMSKDPIFAFNPALPDVSRVHNVNNVVYGNGKDCSAAAVVANYDDGSTYTYTCAIGEDCWNNALTASAVPGASPLKNVQVLDETGEPVNFDVSQAPEVDSFLDNAVAGVPSLTDTEKESLKPPVVEAPPGATPPGTPATVPNLTPAAAGGCQGSGGPAPPMLPAAAALFLLGLWSTRRRNHERAS